MEDVSTSLDAEFNAVTIDITKTQFKVKVTFSCAGFRTECFHIG